MKRREGLPDEIVMIADKALRRLRKKSRMMQKNRKSAKKIVAAIARELTGFIWAIAQATPEITTPEINSGARSSSHPQTRSTLSHR